MGCSSCLKIADDYGDNEATFHCQLSEGHDGFHRETYKTRQNGIVTVTWEKSDEEG